MADMKIVLYVLVVDDENPEKEPRAIAFGIFSRVFAREKIYRRH